MTKPKNTVTLYFSSTYESFSISKLRSYLILFTYKTNILYINILYTNIYNTTIFYSSGVKNMSLNILIY